MIPLTRNGLTFFQFGSLSDCHGLDHAVFTRHGGVGSPPFDTLNLSAGQGDDPTTVRKNRKAVAGCFDHDRLVFLNQVHQTGIRIFKSDRSPAPADGVREEGDAMISDVPGLLLGIKLADCQSVILFDPGKRVTANIHSGWRGSVADIIGRTVRAMSDEFQCRPADILAGISPSLGPCCAEFINYQQEIPPGLWSYKDSRHHFDFWKISRDQLTTAGLREENIETAGICTRCRSDLFFSYRGEGRTGRFVTLAGIKKVLSFKGTSKN